MQTTRRQFLGAAAAATTFAAAGAFVAPASAQTALDPRVTGISRDALLARINARQAAHRQVFMATRPNGNVFTYVRNSLNGYQFGWNEGPGTLYPFVIFNGLGVAQGANSAMWSKYRLADVLAANNAALRGPVNGNPWWTSRTDARNDADIAAPFNQDTGMITLQKRGMDMVVCDTALGTLALAVVGAGAASDPNAVRADVRANLVPGAQLTPSGAAALDYLQSQHFTLYDANI